mgnify:CR=1 FL=1
MYKRQLEKEGAASKYANLEKMLEDRLSFKLQSTRGTVNGESFLFARFTVRPMQLALDRLFKISIVLMLFFVMLVMCLSLTFKSFKLVFQKPKGMLAGAFLQWAVMPLVAGDPTDTREAPTGRIRNARKLLTTAALIMSVMLIGSSLVTTLLVSGEPSALRILAELV